jgi:hypothetical protein
MYVLSVQYSCAVVLVFLVWWEGSFSTNFLVESKNFLLVFLALYGSTTIQSRSFLKNIKNFVWFPKQYLLGFFLLEKQFTNIPDRGFLFLRYTLLLYSLSPYSGTERLTESQIHLLRVGWRNLFSSYAAVSVFCSGVKWVLVLHTSYVLRVRYSCGVMLVFWFWREIVFGVAYVLSVQYRCAVVSVFLLWPES